MNPRIASRSPAGFTLIELMISLAVLAVLLGIAIPSFRSYLASERTRVAAYSLQVALSAARSEAIKRNHTVDIIPTSTASPVEWAAGWKSQVTATDDTGTTTTTDILAQNSLSGVTISGPNSLSYLRNGRPSSTSRVDFTITPTDSTGATRCLFLDIVGLPVVKTLSGTTCGGM